MNKVLFFIFSVVSFILIKPNAYSVSPESRYLRVFNEDTIYYLGFDFNQLKYCVDEGEVKNENISLTIPAWEGYINFMITPQTTLKRWLKKEHIVSYPCNFSCKNDINNREWVVWEDIYTADIHAINESIRNYDIDVEKGIALIAHVISLNKIRGRAYVQYTFFDIEERKIILSILTNGAPQEYGFNAYWGTAIHYSFKHFIDDYYKPRYAELVIEPAKIRAKEAKKKKKQSQ